METKKCPNCRAIIPSLTNVCEYCDTTVENVPTVSDTSSDKPSLDSAINVLEHDLVKLKGVPAPSIGKNLITAILTYFTLGLYLVFRKKVMKKNSFEAIEAIATKNVRNLRTYYGDNTKVKALINELEEELDSLKNLHKKKKRNTNIGCLSIVIIFILILIGSIQEDEEKRSQNKIDDAVIYEKIDSLIEIGQYNKAKSLSVTLEGYDEDKKALNKIQKSKIDKHLDSAKELILENKLDQAEMVLIDIIWEPIDVKDYGEDRISTEDKEMIKIIDDKKQSLINMINKKRAGN
jgi:hypothetical protein|tara:strand:- start:2213 stop:3088 length:876 start_codon:yes stop_codon:yes gene_type:complete